MEKQIAFGIKELLPIGWVEELMSLASLSKSTVLDIVNNEKIEHPAWEHVLSLAEKEKARRLEMKLRTEALTGEKSISEGKKAAMRQPLG